MASRHRIPRFVRRLIVSAVVSAAIGAVRDKLFARNQDRYGPPPRG